MTTDLVTSLNIDFRLIMPEIALLIGASLILLVAFTRRLAYTAPILGTLGLMVAFAFSVGQWNMPGTGFAGMVTVDRFSVMFKMLAAVGSVLSLMIAYRYLSSRNINRPEFYALLLFSTMGMMTMASSTDLIVIFLGLEIMSVPLYVMASFNRRSLESNEAGVKYFIMGAFATGFLLMGIAFVYGASGTTSLERIVTDFAYIAATSSFYLYSGAALILIGFAFKVAAVPFHAWVPDVYQGAPTPITAFFSVGPKAAGFAALLRIFNFGFTDLGQLTVVFWVLAVATMTVGNILALRQDNVKRMLAYSSIAHAGYVLVAMTVGGPEAISAAIFYLVAYTFFNLGAFAVITLLETRRGMQSDFSELAGLSQSNPVLSVALAIFMFSLTGFPPTVGFFGKFYIFASAVQKEFIWLTVIGVMNSFVSVYYYLRVVKVVYFDTTEQALVPARMTPAMMVVIIVTVLGTLGMGFFPDQLLTLSQTALFAVK